MKAIYKYKFNGKELQDELGLNVTAMDYRQYDMAIGRFMNPDRLAELAFDYTPYRYAYNNPIFFKDSSGLYEVDKDGNINITNTDEIKRFMSYVQNNKGSSTSDMIGHVMDAKNGFSLDLPEVFVTNRNQSGEGSFQNAISQSHKNQSFIMNKLNSGKGDISVLGFDANGIDGFLNADASNMKSASAWTGYAGLHLSKTESLLEYVGATDDVLKASASLGKKLGYAGVAFSVYEDVRDNKVGVGTGVKTVIGVTTTVLATAFPVATLTYALIDLTVGVTTGTSLTDRIATGIENATKE